MLFLGIGRPLHVVLYIADRYYSSLSRYRALEPCSSFIYESIYFFPSVDSIEGLKNLQVSETKQVGTDLIFCADKRCYKFGHLLIYFLTTTTLFSCNNSKIQTKNKFSIEAEKSVIAVLILFFIL